MIYFKFSQIKWRFLFNYGQLIVSLNDQCEVKLCFYVGFSFGEMKQKINDIRGSLATFSFLVHLQDPVAMIFQRSMQQVENSSTSVATHSPTITWLLQLNSS